MDYPASSRFKDAQINHTDPNYSIYYLDWYKFSKFITKKLDAISSHEQTFQFKDIKKYISGIRTVKKNNIFFLKLQYTNSNPYNLSNQENRTDKNSMLLLLIDKSDKKASIYFKKRADKVDINHPEEYDTFYRIVTLKNIDNYSDTEIRINKAKRNINFKSSQSGLGVCHGHAQSIIFDTTPIIKNFFDTNNNVDNNHWIEAAKFAEYFKQIDRIARKTVATPWEGRLNKGLEILKNDLLTSNRREKVSVSFTLSNTPGNPTYSTDDISIDKRNINQFEVVSSKSLEEVLNDIDEHNSFFIFNTDEKHAMALVFRNNNYIFFDPSDKSVDYLIKTTSKLNMGAFLWMLSELFKGNQYIHYRKDPL